MPLVSRDATAESWDLSGVPLECRDAYTTISFGCIKTVTPESALFTEVLYANSNKRFVPGANTITMDCSLIYQDNGGMAVSITRADIGIGFKKYDVTTQIRAMCQNETICTIDVKSGGNSMLAALQDYEIDTGTDTELLDTDGGVKLLTVLSTFYSCECPSGYEPGLKWVTKDPSL